MTPWILAVLALWVAHLFLPTSVFYVVADKGAQAQYLHEHMRGRDNLPDYPALAARAKRAQANFAESMPVFLGLALLHEVHGDAPALAVQGAMVFFAARLLYAPAYLAAVPLVRSVVWFVGVGGLVMMTWPLLS